MRTMQLRTQLPKVADLCNALTMLPALHKAHQKLDTAVEAAHQPSGSKKTTPPTPKASAFYSTSTNVAPACCLPSATA